MHAYFTVLRVLDQDQKSSDERHRVGCLCFHASAAARQDRRPFNVTMCSTNLPQATVDLMSVSRSVPCQLSELRQRLEQAEADRQELQEELRREREAREKLERTITQLKQQMAQSGAVGGSPSPPLTPCTGPPNAHSPPSSTSSSFSEAPAAGQK